MGESGIMRKIYAVGFVYTVACFYSFMLFSVRFATISVPDWNKEFPVACNNEPDDLYNNCCRVESGNFTAASEPHDCMGIIPPETSVISLKEGEDFASVVETVDGILTNLGNVQTIFTTDSNNLYETHKVQYTSGVGFPDDIACRVSLIDADSVEIAIQSEARLGTMDGGVNKNRVMKIYEELEARS